MGRSFQVLWAVTNECDYWMVWSRYAWFCKNSIYLFIFGVPSITEPIYLLNVEAFCRAMHIELTTFLLVVMKNRANLTSLYPSR